MNPGTSRLPFVATLFAMSMAVMGSTDAFTVHSIIEKPDEPGARHGMYGLWVRHTIGSSYLLISDGPKLRGHLERHLSRVVDHCDADGGGWKVFNRVSPMPEPDPGTAPEEPADESSSGQS